MITWIVDTVNSKCDYYGNCYWYATYTNCKTGKSVRFLANHRSNVEHVAHELAGDWSHLYCTSSELPKREWQRIAKALPYLNDCDAVEAAKIIRKATRKAAK